MKFFQSISRLVTEQFILLRLKQASLIYVLFLCWFAVGLDANADNILSQWDQQLFDRFYDAPPRQEPMWTVMEGISEFGHYRSIMGVSILLMAYGDEDHQRTGRLLSSAYIGAGVMTYGVKQLVRRKRPLDETLGNPSLPSGHATIAFSAATILGIGIRNGEFHCILGQDWWVFRVSILGGTILRMC